MPRRDRLVLLGLTLLSVALATVQSVTGLSPDVLLAVPALLLVLPLLAGATSARTGSRGSPPARSPPPPPLAVAARRAAARAPRVLPRGGRLIAAALAERAPPALAAAR